MSNRRAYLGLLALFIGGAGVLPGQNFLGKPVDALAARPEAPFVKQDGAIAYTAAFVFRAPRVPPADPARRADFDRMLLDNPRIKEVHVEKVGSTRHDVRAWNDGALQNEAWYFGEGLFEKRPDDPTHVPLARTLDCSQSFPELLWVNAGTFAGAIQEGPTKRIDVYRTPEKMAGTFVPFVFLSGSATAYVDHDTRLPLAFKTDDYVATYTYGEAPAQLDMPPEYQQAVQLFKERIANIPQPP